MPTHVIMLCLYTALATFLTIEGRKMRAEGSGGFLLILGVGLFAAVGFQLVTGIRL